MRQIRQWTEEYFTRSIQRSVEQIPDGENIWYMDYDAPDSRDETVKSVGALSLKRVFSSGEGKHTLTIDINSDDPDNFCPPYIEVLEQVTTPFDPYACKQLPARQPKQEFQGYPEDLRVMQLRGVAKNLREVAGTIRRQDS